MDLLLFLIGGCLFTWLYPPFKSSVKEGVLSHIWRVVYEIYGNPIWPKIPSFTLLSRNQLTIPFEILRGAKWNISRTLLFDSRAVVFPRTPLPFFFNFFTDPRSHILIFSLPPPPHTQTFLFLFPFRIPQDPPQDLKWNSPKRSPIPNWYLCATPPVLIIRAT